MSADKDDLTPHIPHVPGDADTDLSQVIQHLLVMNDRAEGLDLAMLAGRLFGQFEGAPDAKAKAYSRRFFYSGFHCFIVPP
jgi:hypothetical protein